MFNSVTKPPTMHKTVPKMKNYPAKNTNVAPLKNSLGALLSLGNLA